MDFQREKDDLPFVRRVDHERHEGVPHPQKNVEPLPDQFCAACTLTFHAQDGAGRSAHEKETPGSVKFLTRARMAQSFFRTAKPQASS